MQNPLTVVTVGSDGVFRCFVVVAFSLSLLPLPFGEDNGSGLDGD